MKAKEYVSGSQDHILCYSSLIHQPNALIVVWLSARVIILNCVIGTYLFMIYCAKL